MKSLNQGFTLVELMVVIALVGILMAYAIPSLTSFVRVNSVVSVKTDLLFDIQFARSEAITRNAPVTICAASTTSTPTVPVCAGLNATDWRNGWIIFQDDFAVPANPAAVPPVIAVNPINGVIHPLEPILRINTGPTSTTMTIDALTTSGLNIQGALGFLGDGYPVLPVTQASPTGEFRVCENNNVNHSRLIKINRTGRIESTGIASTCGASSSSSGGPSGP